MPLARLLVLEWISLRHDCCASEIIDCRGILLGVYRDFSAVAVHDAIVEAVEVADGLTSRKRKPHDAKLFETVLFGWNCCTRGRLQENVRLELCTNVVLENVNFRGNPAGFDATNWLAVSRKWDNNLCVMFEDILSRSS